MKRRQIQKQKGEMGKMGIKEDVKTQRETEKTERKTEKQRTFLPI